MLQKIKGRVDRKIIKLTQDEISKFQRKSLEPTNLVDSHGRQILRDYDGALIALEEVAPYTSTGLATELGITVFEKDLIQEPPEEKKDNSYLSSILKYGALVLSLGAAAVTAILAPNVAYAQDELANIQPAQDELAKDAKQPLKANITQTEVVAKGQKPISRNEILVNKLPLNSDIYFVWENKGNNDFYKLRAQIIPFKYRLFELGVAAQHVDGTAFDAHNELGLVTRIKRKPSKDSFAKIDLRYFPSKDSLDTYALFSNKSVFADLLGSYNLKTNKAMFRLGIDRKINKDLSVGLEGKFSGKIENLKENYVGLRAKINF